MCMPGEPVSDVLQIKTHYEGLDIAAKQQDTLPAIYAAG